MKRLLYYYNAFVLYNDQVTNIHVSELFDAIRAVDVKKRLKHLKLGNICLMNMSQPNLNVYDHSDRKLVLGKFREEKPYLSNIGTDRIEAIPDDVVELTSLFYRRNSRLIIAEYNHYGLRPSGLQYYLNSFLPFTKDNKWEVVLEPIEPDLGFNDVANSKDIKNIEFKIDLTSKEKKIFESQKDEVNHKSVLGNILNKSIEVHQEFGANFAKIGFSNGRKWRSNVIDAKQLVATLRAVDLDSDAFESVKVTYVSPKTGKKEEIDLKNQGVLKQVLDLDSDGWEYTCNQIEDFFYNQGRIGENNHLDYKIVKFVNLPELIYNNFD